MVSLEEQKGFIKSALTAVKKSLSLKKNWKKVKIFGPVKTLFIPEKFFKKIQKAKVLG